jgi:hypothetical protein
MIEGAFRRYEHDVLIGGSRHERVGRYLGFLRRHRGETVDGTFGTDPTSAIAGPIRDWAAEPLLMPCQDSRRRRGRAQPHRMLALEPP